MSRFTIEELEAVRSADSREETYQQRQERYEQRLHVEIYKGSYALPQLLLSSALFGVGIGPRATLVKARLEAFGGGEITFSGEALRQDDKRAFMALIHAVRARPLNGVIDVVPREFVRAVGWSNSKNSIDNLKLCIERLQDATLEVLLADGREGVRAKMVGVFKRNATGWHVELSDTVRHLFIGSSTYLSIEGYRQVRDGLQTWLLSFLKARYAEHSFDIADLHRFSGSTASLANFATNLREAARRLVAAGVFPPGISFSYGRLHVLPMPK